MAVDKTFLATFSQSTLIRMVMELNTELELQIKTNEAASVALKDLDNQRDSLLGQCNRLERELGIAESTNRGLEDMLNDKEQELADLYAKYNERNSPTAEIFNLRQQARAAEEAARLAYIENMRLKRESGQVETKNRYFDCTGEHRLIGQIACIKALRVIMPELKLSEAKIIVEESRYIELTEAEYQWIIDELPAGSTWNLYTVFE